MAIEVTPAMVSRLLIHLRERIMQELEEIQAALPEDVERHTERVYIGAKPRNLIQMMTERTKAENWVEQPTGTPVCLDGLKELVDEIGNYLDALPNE